MQKINSGLLTIQSLQQRWVRFDWIFFRVYLFPPCATIEYCGIGDIPDVYSFMPDISVDSSEPKNVP